MQKITLVFILFAIIALSIASYFLISKFSKPQNASLYPALPMVKVTVKPTSEPTPMQTPKCLAKNLQATIEAQGAAGSIYGNLEMSNKGKSACTVELGNTITGIVDAKNIKIHNQNTVSAEIFTLDPGAKVYSRVHFPNGPQCQSGITPKPITFIYKTGQITVSFQSNTPQSGTLQVQSCTAPSEITTIDIWPLSENPVTP